MIGYHLNRIGSFMTLSRRSLLATLAAVPLVTLASRPVFAAYPDRPIRLIVPFAPGGNADLVGRLLSESMSPTLGCCGGNCPNALPNKPPLEPLKESEKIPAILSSPQIQRVP